jgi:signal peptidase II
VGNTLRFQVVDCFVGSLRGVLSLLLPLGALVGCDHVTKIAAKSQLENQAPRELVRSVLELRYVENTDIGFNLLRWIPENVRLPLMLVFGALAILALGVWLLRGQRPPLERAALVFILAGALGNYTDRLARGYVVDFIHLRHWPVFNAADVWLSAGLVLMLWSSLRARPARAAVTGAGGVPPSG